MRHFLLRKRVFLLLVVVGLLVFASFAPLRTSFSDWEHAPQVLQLRQSLLSHWQWLSDWRALGAYFAGLGAGGMAGFVLLSGLACALGMPRLLICAVAGLAYGVAWGLALSQCAVMLGAYVTFLFARWGGVDFVLHRWPQLEDLLNTVEGHGIVSIFLIRQVPISGFLANLVLGLSAVRQRDFLIGSFIGFLPEAIPATVVGAGLPAGNLAHIMQLLVAAGLLLVFMTWQLKQFMRRQQAGDGMPALSGKRALFEQAFMYCVGVAGAGLCLWHWLR